MALQRQNRRRRAGGAKQTVVRIALREEGPLGLDLVVTRGDAGVDALQVTGVRGQTAQLLRERRLRLDKGATLIQVDDRDVEDFAKTHDVVKAVTAPDRPKRLAFLSAEASAARQKAAAQKRKQKQGLTIKSFEIFAASPPKRPVASVGVTLRRHDALDEAVEVKADDDDALPSGTVLVACTGAPRLVAPRGQRAAPATVGALIKKCVVRAAETGDAFSLAVAPPPDTSVTFAGPPTDLIFQKLDDVGFVLVGLVPLPSPLALAGALPGDLVVAVGSQRFPSLDGYAADVAAIKDVVLDAASQEEGSFDVVLRRRRRRRTPNSEDDDDDDDSVEDIPVTVGKLGGPRLGVTFARCHETQLPKIKRFDGVPGLAARSDAWQSRKLRPGLSLVGLADLHLPDLSLDDLDAALRTHTTAVFRDVEAYEDMLARFSLLGDTGGGKQAPL